MRDIFRILVGTFVVSLTITLFIVITRQNMYQFTTYQISSNNNKNMVWISKVSGRTQCSELSLYKKLINAQWILIDSVCVDGKDRANNFIEADHDTWLKDKFNDKQFSQAYAHFRDKNKNDSLIYFSNPNNTTDEISLRDIASFFKDRISDWRIVPAREM